MTLGKDFGKALINKKRKQNSEPADIPLELASNTKENELDDFLAQASLEGTNFESEKLYVKFISTTQVMKRKYNILSSEEEAILMKKFDELEIKLKLPRRPKWNSKMSKEELHSLEDKEFLNWRSNLAEIEETQQLLMTPFEKNLYVWKELWRVVEKGDLIVQIVDARNPLLFRCIDLESYVLEVDPRKKNLLLVNKADLLTRSQRDTWSEYFSLHNIDFVFFSAKGVEDQIDVLDVDQLVTELVRRCPEPLHKSGTNPGMKTVSFCGHPNVGKSSTINSIVGTKKVTVSSTPGKTKHFQTLMINPQLCLCDCPGLVFPSFASTRADMVCNGILPIDNLTDFLSPVELIVKRIPPAHLSKIYGLSVPKVADSEDFLSVLAKARGFMRSGFGSPDTSRSARIVLKDYVDGKLVYAKPPPLFEGVFNVYDETGRVFNKETLEDQVDNEFFTPKPVIKAKTIGVAADDDYTGQKFTKSQNSKKHYKGRKGNK
eukprot:NODE_140_length_17926_cov_0.139620.p2 type:complete len:489 gc:universal NODE_140_length_17926_cov_0.139620:15829-17295(+)